MRSIRYRQLSTLFFLLSVQIFSSAFGQSKKSVLYLNRAEIMYHSVWNHYRVPGFGLFSENFPSSHSGTLNYFQGGEVKEKAVSFLWPFSGMLSATNALLKSPLSKKKYLPFLDSLICGLEEYKDTIRRPSAYQAYPVRFEKADRYYDDNGLVGIEYMEAYFNTYNPLYLQRAKEVFSFILSGWDQNLSGGIYWLEFNKDFKPACSNGMATLTALKIYEATKDTFYLKWGERFYGWMYDHLRNANGLYENDEKLDGSKNNTLWTYNSGSMLEASVLLFRFTKQKKYLNEAHHIAVNAFQVFGKRSKSPQLALDIDLPWFITVLFRGYAALYTIDNNDHYIKAFENSLDYAWMHSRDQYGFVTHDWLPNAAELHKPKWLLDECCIAELYARLSEIEKRKESVKIK